MSEVIERRFREIGVPVRMIPDGSWFSMRVGRSAAKEWIHLSPGAAELTVLDADRSLHQLLLLVRNQDGYGRPSKRKFLVGRDERSLFAVPVSTLDNPLNLVEHAHQALQPYDLRHPPTRRRTTRVRRGQRRRPPRYLAPPIVRQGDWFFEPRPWIDRNPAGMRRNVRLGGGGGGNPHLVEYLLGDERNLFGGFWRSWTGGVFARGFVRHREHKPIHLRYWHRVLPNAASQAMGWAID